MTIESTVDVIDQLPEENILNGMFQNEIKIIKFILWKIFFPSNAVLSDGNQIMSINQLIQVVENNVPNENEPFIVNFDEIVYQNWTEPEASQDSNLSNLDESGTQTNQKNKKRTQWASEKESNKRNAGQSYLGYKVDKETGKK